MQRSKTEEAAKELYAILEKMCDLFDIPRIEEFVTGEYHETPVRKPATQITKVSTTQNTNFGTPTLENAKNLLRKMFPDSKK